MLCPCVWKDSRTSWRQGKKRKWKQHISICINCISLGANIMILETNLMLFVLLQVNGNGKKHTHQLSLTKTSALFAFVLFLQVSQTIISLSNPTNPLTFLAQPKWFQKTNHTMPDRKAPWDIMKQGVGRCWLLDKGQNNYLKVVTTDAASDPPKQWDHDLLEFSHIDCL